MLKKRIPSSKKELEALVNDIADTCEELQNSVHISHRLEHQSVLTETQQLIDKRRLKLSLDREKYQNKQLRKFIMSTTDNTTTASYADSDDSASNDRYLELRRLLQTRDSQLLKAQCKIHHLSDENEALKRALNEHQDQIKEMEQATDVVASYLSDLQDQVNLQETYESYCGGNASRREIENELMRMRTHYEDQIVDLISLLDNQTKINAQLDEERLYLASKLSKLENKRKRGN